LAKAWIGIAGPGEVAIRFPSACFSLLSVYLTYALARRFVSVPVASLASLLVAFSPLEIMVGQSARMYALLGTLALASTLVLVAAVERGGIRWWGIYAGTTALMIYTHYLGFAVLIAHATWMLWCNRRPLRAWLGSGIVVALLYVPWVPFWWTQIVRAPGHWPGWGWISAREGMLSLLGLFSFGGSLFGMPGFYVATQVDRYLDLGEQFLVVLPFLAVAACGVWALIADRRTVVLLGSLLVIPIGLMLALSLAGSAFIPRWFGFLHPFYAMLLARGIVMLAQSIRGRSGQIVTGATIGVLLYSVPVLSHYFLDPGFHPFQWRGAAAIVRESVRPGDFFIYGDHSNYLSFTYYFEDRYPRMLLVLDYEHELAVAHNPRLLLSDAAQREIRRLPERYGRVWLVVAYPFPNTLFQQTVSALQRGYVLAGRVQFGRDRFTGVDVQPSVYLFRASQPPGSPHP